MSAKVIFHIDLNAFYASVAQNQDPNLIGKPLVVSKNRTGAVVTTASYEAREKGIHSAMPLSIALSKEPNLIVVEPDFQEYARMSELFINYIKTISPLVEVLSIDECYVDVTKEIVKYEKPLDLAYKIQSDLKQLYNLSCSIGVAPNRFLAKMASDFMKPMGISVLRKREVKRKLWPLPIEDFYGIGKVTQNKLKSIGVKTIGDLVTIDFEKLETILGNQTQAIIDRANGHDSDVLEIESEVKSISASNSLLQGINDYQELNQILFSQCEDIVDKINKHQLIGLTLSVGVAINQQRLTSKSMRNEGGFSRLDQIYQSALLLLDQFDLDQTVTHLSTSLSNLKAFEEDEIYNLFNYQQQDHSVNDIIEKINTYFDKGVLKKASQTHDSDDS